MMGESLKNVTVKKAFLEVFAEKGYENHITYFQFYQTFKNVLGITNVAEWMLEDFMSQLDIKDKAEIELNEIAIWLKKYDVDIGV